MPVLLSMARWTQSTPVETESSNESAIMTVSMATCASWMSIAEMMLLRVAMSESLPAVTSSALMRSSARIEMFSPSSCPMRARVSADWATRVRAGAGASDLSPSSRRAPGRASSSEFLRLLIQSFRSVATSLATACSRRITSARLSGEVGMSSSEIILSKKTMFSGRVRRKSRFVRSSATIVTLPRMMPRAASSSVEAIVSVVGAAGAGASSPRRLRNVTPWGSGRRSTPGAPVVRSWIAVFCLAEDCSSPCAALTSSSRRDLMSEALAFWMWRTMTSSSVIAGRSR